MSVDSRNKRMSMLNIGMPFCDDLMHPDGAIANVDRALLLRLYAMALGYHSLLPEPYITSIGWLSSSQTAKMFSRNEPKLSEDYRG